eukprot:TRINITY_DN1137_c0_g1_i1.p1 TRINITY_DN1137_c0_g1~~TRINITY_DN1137_c0_g1_i1.p1  ORF type:complete len:114 (-),score=3.80 TRINITY_DN1137_c0_g1_i1:353-694(-)
MFVGGVPLYKQMMSVQHKDLTWTFKKGAERVHQGVLQQGRYNLRSNHMLDYTADHHFVMDVWALHVFGSSLLHVQHRNSSAHAVTITDLDKKWGAVPFVLFQKLYTIFSSSRA